MRHAWKVYAAAGAILVGLYGYGEAVGWEVGTAARTRMDASVRQSPGGWRSWTFWHRGVHGGK
jgi:hypothetical protein